MNMLKKLFAGGKASEKPRFFEIIEDNLSTDLTKFQVRVRKSGREIYAEEFFQGATKPNDLTFGRFYLLNENPPKLHFAPSQEKAVNWFKGRDLPKDGYYNIFWGKEVTFKCRVCRKEIKQPLKITKLEKYTISTDEPKYMEIMGWRVSEVACDLMGPGVPRKILYMFKTKPIIQWLNPKNKFICEGCAHSLISMGRQAELKKYVIFK